MECQVRGAPDASEEVKIEDETAHVERDLQPLGSVERTSSVRASSITQGSVGPPNVEDGLDESIEVDEEGGVDESAAAAATTIAAAATTTTADASTVGTVAVGATGEDNETPHWHDDEPKQPSRPQVVVDEALPTGDINSPGAAKALASSYPSDDQCCTFKWCGFPNGCFPVVFAQFFVFCGLILCSWSVVDCKFIVATAGFPETDQPGVNSTMTPQPLRRGFGFLFNETEQGGCRYTQADFESDEIEYYFEFLGSDWNIPRYLTGAAAGLGWILFAGLLTFECFSYVRTIRWLIATILILIMGGLQASSFSVIGSSFCSDEAYCEPSRGMWTGVAGIGCYFIAAIMCCMMKDFPGAFA